jgi:hypothetical protein
MEPQMDDDAGETFHPLFDTDDWQDFWEVNGEALEDEIGDEQVCFALACNCNLMVGGGAAELIRVGFVDERAA